MLGASRTNTLNVTKTVAHLATNCNVECGIWHHTYCRKPYNTTAECIELPVLSQVCRKLAYQVGNLLVAIEDWLKDKSKRKTPNHQPAVHVIGSTAGRGGFHLWRTTVRASALKMG